MPDLPIAWVINGNRVLCDICFESPYDKEKCTAVHSAEQLKDEKCSGDCGLPDFSESSIAQIRGLQDSRENRGRDTTAAQTAPDEDVQSGHSGGGLLEGIGTIVTAVADTADLVITKLFGDRGGLPLAWKVENKVFCDPCNYGSLEQMTPVWTAEELESAECGYCRRDFSESAVRQIRREQASREAQNEINPDAREYRQMYYSRL